MISIHALRKERDFFSSLVIAFGKISIHALRKERDIKRSDNRSYLSISIHALRKERDAAASHCRERHRDFNPRAPQGARLLQMHSPRNGQRFQSTRSARSATIIGRCSLVCMGNFNPRAPQGARRWSLPLSVMRRIFQSTRSARSATKDDGCGSRRRAISIHALRKERDCHLAEHVALIRISIHALRKERDSKSGHKRPLLRCIHNDYSPHMCFFLMFTSTNLIQLDF